MKAVRLCRRLPLNQLQRRQLQPRRAWPRQRRPLQPRRVPRRQRQRLRPRLHPPQPLQLLKLRRSLSTLRKSAAKSCARRFSILGPKQVCKRSPRENAVVNADRQTPVQGRFVRARACCLTKRTRTSSHQPRLLLKRLARSTRVGMS